MDVFSSEGSFLFMIIISCSALLSQSVTEITKDNCKYNRTFLSECSFNISFQPPLTEKLECFLTFPTKTNYSVRFSSESFVLQRQVGQMCPMFYVEIWTQEKKPKRLFTTCGGTKDRVSRTFYNFTWGHIFYDNKGLRDNSTTMKMQLRLETGKTCDDLESKSFNVKTYLSWIVIILSAAGSLVIIILGAAIAYHCHFKENENETQNSPSPEAGIPSSKSVEDVNGKGMDLEDDNKSQGLLERKSSEG